MVAAVTLTLAGISVLGLTGWLWRRWRGPAPFGSPAERAAYQALHQASLASPPLRDGLNATSATSSARHLRTLLATPGLAITDQTGVLAWEIAGNSPHRCLGGTAHRGRALEVAAEAWQTGETAVLRGAAACCADIGCGLKGAVAVPLRVDDEVVGVLTTYAPSATPGLVRATEEVAAWVCAQLELARLGAERSRAAEAELRALRAQISPHFIYNALTAIASFVRTDPPRARELLLEFADFTRYTLGTQGEFTTLAQELRSIDRYLLLERARFGDRLSVTLKIAPEVLAVAVPFLCLQPLVENAVRHGLEGVREDSVGYGHIEIVAQDAGPDCRITIEDDGRGMDPEHLQRILSGVTPGDERSHLGLSNVDGRMRQVYGDGFGLVVETAPGAGTKVHLLIPKYAEGVRAS